MRSCLILALFGLICTGHLLAEEAPSTPEQRFAYLYGHGPIAQHLKQFCEQYGVQPADILRGINDGLAGKESLVPDSEQGELFQTLEQKRAQREQAAGADNAKRSAAYIEEVKTRAGMVVTASGLCYEELVAGEGAQPQATDTVKVHYRGTLIDGKEFDSSYGRGTPTSFRVDRVIPGWTEALQLMKVGGKWRLHIPAALAYGEKAPPSIGPNQALVFEVELLDVLPRGE
jgi:FKBP-type peptidyl-prolyl cis-trans isomerase FklB